MQAAVLSEGSSINAAITNMPYEHPSYLSLDSRARRSFASRRRKDEACTCLQATALVVTGGPW